METIKQTPVGWVLCKVFGLHLLVWGKVSRENGLSFSLYGGCVRCNKGFGWDA